MSAALVTGGSAGIGRAVVQRLLAAGARGHLTRPAAERPRRASCEVDLTDAVATREAAAEFARRQVLYVCGGTNVGSLTL